MSAAKQRVGEATLHLAAAEEADDSSPTKMDAITGAAQELSDAQEALRIAEAELVEFQSGRPASASADTRFALSGPAANVPPPGLMVSPGVEERNE